MLAFRRIGPAFILLTAAVGLYFGWKLFWFLTDDAFIAFRYVNNSISGHGYVWNPPPFRPVEGYTSFLWIVLLDGIWRVFDATPPEVANSLSLVFSYATLTVVFITVMRMKLRPAFERWRPLFLGLVLLGIVSNRTFLAWTSSGMETAMFDFFFVSWTLVAFRLGNRGRSWLLAWATLATLGYLSRPDGVLLVLATLVFLVYDCGRRRAFSTLLLSASPLLLVPLHLGWRHSFYGEWLPNTYHAKVVAPWPEAGLRYSFSFALEYALWAWFIFAMIWILRRPRGGPQQRSPKRNALPVRRLSTWVDALFSSPTRLALLVLFAHLAYYTFVVGGDHFEYRVYSHLIPLVFVSFLWLENELDFRPKRAIAFFCVFVLFSWPIPWTHWRLTHRLSSRDETVIMIRPVSHRVPVFFRWYTEPFDQLQRWLIRHFVCMRHQEHKIFYESQKNRFPSRDEGEKISSSGYPVLATPTVGVPGWVLPHVAILDRFGLNDYVIARSPYRRPDRDRWMAHDRSPPPGYVESFAPNLYVEQPGRMGIEARERELTADDIIANEAHWAALVSQ